MKKQAFTLSEVLIALTVIGVIAALTVPTLVQKTQKQEYVSALKKTYSTLSQATNQIIAEHGSPKADKNGETWLKDYDSFYNMYKKYLNNAKECGSSDECYNQDGFKHLVSGNLDTSWHQTNILRKLILSDGTQVLFEYNSKDCSHYWSKDNEVCGTIAVDVNGEKKPNIWGRDAFVFVLKKDGLYPYGCKNIGDNCFNGDGWTCTCQVLKEGAMNY